MPEFKPLTGIRIVELASIGPGPFAAMMLADHGADIIRIEKPGGRNVGTARFGKDPMLRGRRTVELDLKLPEDAEKALALITRADALIEGFRPGVTERLGLGPQECHVVNPALVYGRMTGWGQDGPLAPRAGHDINYIALTGALDAIGTPESGPVPPMNLVGDFGGGGMLLAYGMAAALLPAKLSGKGTVIDAAMVDGTSLLMTMPYALKAQGLWSDGRGENLLDGGAPFYGTYKTSDDKWIALGAIEEPFWQEMIQLLGLSDGILKKRMSKSSWAEIRKMVAEKISENTRAHWENLFDGTDACFAPILTQDEAPQNEHIQHRKTFAVKDGVVQPAPAPRYDGQTPSVPETETTPVAFETVFEEWNRDT